MPKSFFSVRMQTPSAFQSRPPGYTSQFEPPTTPPSTLATPLTPLPPNPATRTPIPAYNPSFDVDINTRIAEAAKSHASYKRMCKTFNDWCINNLLGDIDTIGVESSLNIVRYMMSMNLRGIENKQKKNGYGSIELFTSAIKYHYSHVHPIASKEQWDVNTLKGNPGMSPRIQALLKSFKTDSKDDISKQAHALSLHQLGAINTALCQIDLSEMEQEKYACMFAMAFYCWLRIDELESLRMRNLQMGHQYVHGDGEFVVSFGIVNLFERKTDQDALGTDYNLYDDMEEPELLVYSKLKTGLKRVYFQFM